jgi:protein gp37
MGPGKPSLIFVVVLGDLFYTARPTADIDMVVGTIASSRHIGLLVSKYVDQMAAYFATGMWEPFQSKLWLIFSAEDQEHFDSRWLLLRPLAERGWLVGVDLAPLVGPVRLPDDALALLRWVILAGECVSGTPGSIIRPMDPAWARSIKRQCRDGGIPLFVKRMTGEDPIPPDLLDRQFPKIG